MYYFALALFAHMYICLSLLFFLLSNHKKKKACLFLTLGAEVVPTVCFLNVIPA